MKVKQMTTANGKPVANQFIIMSEVGNSTVQVFQSYNSVICKKVWSTLGLKVVLDEEKWNVSITTGKYRNQFLGETKAETLEKIKSGEYTFENLN